MEKNKRCVFFRVAKALAIVGILAIFTIIVVYACIKMGGLLSAVLAAAFIAYLLLPLQRIFEKYIPKWLSAILCVVISFGSIVLTVSFLIPVLFKQLNAVTSHVSYIIDWLNNILSKVQIKINEMNIPVSIDKIFDGWGDRLMAYLTDVSNGLIYKVIAFFEKIPLIFIVPILTFYFLKDRRFFVKYFVFLIPVKWRHPLSKIYKGADKVIKNYVKTQLIVAFIVGFATMIGYILLGMPYSVLMGLLMGICEIIPYFGPVLGAIPACLITLIWDPSKIIWTIGIVILVQQLESNFLSPYLMGANFDINPITVIVILWIFGNLFGFAGFIFAIPIYVIAKDVGKVVFNKLVKAG